MFSTAYLLYDIYCLVTSKFLRLCGLFFALYSKQKLSDNQKDKQCDNSSEISLLFQVKSEAMSKFP